MVQFQLLGVNDPVPTGYRVATTQDVESNKQDMLQAMPGWEIANLANGSVEGAFYGGNVRYRLATVQDVQANPEALRAAMPGWEIANLVNGSVEGAFYGCNTRNETRNDVGQKLATRDHSDHGPLKFQLFNVRDPLPPAYRLATRSEVESHQQELFSSHARVGDCESGGRICGWGFVRRSHACDKTQRCG